MTDNTPTQTPTPESSLSGTVTTLTAGQLIRAARQKKGVHLAVLSVNLKVPVRQLEALEADQHDSGKGPVFVRALASSVCRQLQMDPAPVLALLPQAPGQMPLRRDSMVPLQSSESRVSLNMMGVLHGLPRQTLVIAVLMLLVIAALLWMPSPSTWRWLQPAPAAAIDVEVPAAAMPEASAAALSEIQAPSVEPVAVVPMPPVVASTPAASVPAPALMASAGATKTVTSVPPSAGAVLGFSASQESWIEIRDGNNQVLWSRVLREGESTQVQYPLPMHVVIGRAKSVNVTYQGKAFDLAPHTKVAVARFEVKE